MIQGMFNSIWNILVTSYLSYNVWKTQQPSNLTPMILCWTGNFKMVLKICIDKWWSTFQTHFVASTYTFKDTTTYMIKPAVSNVDMYKKGIFIY